MKNIEIIDAHHHIWTVEKTPWLQGPMVPRIFGDYSTIKRDYPIEEFAAEAKAVGVVGSVYVQVNVKPQDGVWEVQWAAEQGKRHGLIQAVVSGANLADAGIGDLLDAQAQVSPLRGVREQLHWHENPLYRFQSRPDLFLDKAWQAGLREVGARGLHFELQIFPGQFADALKLVDAFPNVKFVLVHAGMLEETGEEAHVAWRHGLEAFAQRENVFTKLSGFGTFSHRCDADEWAALIRPTVDVFGPDRCLFGSNYPIEKIWTDYASLVGAVKSAISTYSPAEQAAILHGTARGIYKIS